MPSLKLQRISALLSFQPGGIASSEISGTTTNNSASAGLLGEFVSTLVAVGAPVALSTNTAANVGNISLTAGDWDVEGNVNFAGSAATITATSCGLSTTSATLPADGSEVASGLLGTLITETDGATLPRKRISLSATTTVYLVAKCVFSAGSVGTYGQLNARRVR